MIVMIILCLRWNSISNDELLPPPGDVYERSYLTSSQDLLPTAIGNSHNVMMVHPAGGRFSMKPSITVISSKENYSSIINSSPFSFNIFDFSNRKLPIFATFTNGCRNVIYRNDEKFF